MRVSGRPTLVGTTSVEISELLSRMLKLRNIPHQVLNAKLHQKEADIVALAGQSTQGNVCQPTDGLLRQTSAALQPVASSPENEKKYADIDAQGERRATPARSRNHRHQHGRSWYRHQALARREGGRRTGHHRYGAPREPSCRPPVAWTFRTSGRPGFVSILRIARGQTHATLRQRAHR